MTNPASTVPPASSRRPHPRLGLGIGLLAALGAVVFLLASGARPGGPMVFIGLASLTLVLSVELLLRTGTALLREAPPEEVQLATGRRRKELEREKQALLKALKEVEFDHEMRKISDEDYKDIAANYRARAVRVMRLLDDSGTDYKQLVERELKARIEARALGEQAS